VSRPTIAVVTLGVLVCGGTFLIADKTPSGPEPKSGTEVKPGYVVSAAWGSPLMLDTSSGKTWLLQRRGDVVAWTPIPRLETEKEVTNWQSTARIIGPDGTGSRDLGTLLEPVMHF